MKLALVSIWNMLFPWWSIDETHGWVDAAAASEVDWSKAYLPVGVKVTGQKSPWVELDADDLHILRVLLTAHIQVRGGTREIGPVFEHSEGLRQLADWSAGALQYIKKSEQGPGNESTANARNHEKKP